MVKPKIYLRLKEVKIYRTETWARKKYDKLIEWDQDGRHEDWKYYPEIEHSPEYNRWIVSWRGGPVDG